MKHATHAKVAGTTGGSVEYATLLRAHGLKATPQRIALLTALRDQKRPLALHDLEHSPHTEGVNQSTLYRAVRECVDAGLIRPVDLRHTHAHYELVTGEEHHHLICTSCGTVEDFTATTCHTLVRTALRESSAFASVRDHAIELYGTCKKCAA